MASRVLLVEGRDDVYVLQRLCEQRGIPGLVKIKPIGDEKRLRENIPVQLQASNEEGDVVGVVIDADTDLSSRWQSIRDRVGKLGYIVPAQPDKGGTIIDPPVGTLYPRFGVWVMPDNQTPGILENFLQFLIPQTDQLLGYAKSCVADIPHRLFSDLAEPKAVIHTWLAWQSDPGIQLGSAINARFLDPDTPKGDELASWLRRLFFPNG